MLFSTPHTKSPTDSKWPFSLNFDVSKNYLTECFRLLFLEKRATFNKSKNPIPNRITQSLSWLQNVSLSEYINSMIILLLTILVIISYQQFSTKTRSRWFRPANIYRSLKIYFFHFLKDGIYERNSIICLHGQMLVINLSPHQFVNGKKSNEKILQKFL